VRSVAILFAIGAVLGTALDQLHVAGGAVSYSKPFAFGQAFWVPALFGGAVVGFADLHRRLRGWMNAPPSAETAALARDFALFAAAYALTAFAPLPTAAVLGILLAVCILRAVLVRERPHRIVHALACAACGVVAEWLLTGAGAFVHHRADFMRVPLWLPALYLLAAPLIGGLDDRLVLAAQRPGA
jgi:hypothetical protein